MCLAVLIRQESLKVVADLGAWLEAIGLNQRFEIPDHVGNSLHVHYLPTQEPRHLLQGPELKIKQISVCSFGRNKWLAGKKRLALVKRTVEELLDFLQLGQVGLHLLRFLQLSDLLAKTVHFLLGVHFLNFHLVSILKQPAQLLFKVVVGCLSPVHLRYLHELNLKVCSGLRGLDSSN